MARTNRNNLTVRMALAALALCAAGLIATPMSAVAQIGSLPGGHGNQAVQAVAPSMSPSTQADDDAYSAASRQNTASAYDAYLALYPTGRHAAEARAAKQRLGGASTPAQAAAPAGAAYDLNALNAQVRNVVISARAAEARGTAASAAARRAAQEAITAASNARSGNWANHVAYDYQDDGDYGRRYEGQYSNDNRNGYGVITFSRGLFQGDRYEGQWANGNYEGAGVYHRAMNENNREYNGLRYEGQYSNSQRNGYGVFLWRGSGAGGVGHRYVGEMRSASRAGFGVMYFADGSRYEGEWGDDLRNGFGVMWTAQGRVAQQGIWANDALTTPVAP